jgi:hypothetical protein
MPDDQVDEQTTDDSQLVATDTVSVSPDGSVSVETGSIRKESQWIR